MPALSHALITTHGDRISVVATDLEVALHAEYPAQVLREGAVCLTAKPLYDIVRSLPGQELVLRETGHGKVELSCGKVSYRVHALSTDSFPSVIGSDAVEFSDIPPGTVREMIEKTLYAVSTDDTRYNLTGVYCEAMPEAPGLRMVSTDGHRLSLVERPTESAPALPEGVIIPRKGLHELRKLIEDRGDEAKLGFYESFVAFEVGGVRLTMRLIDGRFPDYRQVIPPTSPKTVKLDRQSFVQALRRTSLLGSDTKGQGVKLELSSGRLKLSVNNPDLGDAEEELDVGYDGDPLTIGFNCRYLLESLAVLEPDEVHLGLTDELAPGVITAPGDEGFKAVIMPMRI